MYIKRGDTATTKSGLTGIIKTVDFKDNKPYAVGLEVKDDIYTEMFHVLVENLKQ